MTKNRKKRVEKVEKVEKAPEPGVIIRVEVEVRVRPEEMRPYPTIQMLPPEDAARVLIENACIADLRWLDGVDQIVSARTTIIERNGVKLKL